MGRWPAPGTGGLVHDAVYDPASNDNEERSAEWARRELFAHGLSAEDAQFVHEAIMATAGHRAVNAAVAPLLDADLSILGAPSARYAEYRAAIWQEYHAIAEPAFRSARAAFLGSMRARPAIYLTAPARERFEAQARANLATELQELEA